MLVRTAAALVAALALTGCTGQSDAEPVPVATVTVTAEPEVRTRTVERTPAACVEALDLAQEAFSDAGEALGMVPDLLTLIQEAYVAGATGSGVDDITAQLEGANDRLGPLGENVADRAPQFQAANEKCRAAAGEGA